VSKQVKNWARKERARLIALYGGKCNLCASNENLEFDCIEPQGHSHHKKDTSSRMCFYRKMHFLGNLQVLCSKCHNKKSANEQYHTTITEYLASNHPLALCDSRHGDEVPF